MFEEPMKTLRLLVWTDCHKRCPKCCNLNYCIEALPVLETFEGWDAICFTGGEPLLYPDRLRKIVARAAEENATAKRYLYTAMPGNALDNELGLFHGVTISVMDEKDAKAFLAFVRRHKPIPFFTYRLKVFGGKELLRNYLPAWDVTIASWRDHCPLPENETFMRLDY